MSSSSQDNARQLSSERQNGEEGSGTGARGERRDSMVDEKNKKQENSAKSGQQSFGEQTAAGEQNSTSDRRRLERKIGLNGTDRRRPGRKIGLTSQQRRR